MLAVSLLTDSMIYLNYVCLSMIRQSTGPRVKPSVVIPMKILFHDEKYTDENILILQKLVKDAKMTGTPPVCTELYTLN